MQKKVYRAKHHLASTARFRVLNPFPVAVTWSLGVLVCCTMILAAYSLQAQTNFQRLFSFGPDASRGSSPRGPLLQASDGRLYGTTYQGGSNNLGTVFVLERDGSGFRVLHTFDTAMFPFSGVIECGEGLLYGTTSSGGAHDGGTVFRIRKDGSGFEILHDFDAAAGQGSAPLGSLTRATDGKLYGTTAGGGSNNRGSIFRMNLDGTAFETLFSFGGTNGSYPVAGLTQGQDGSFYGVTKNGGAADLGTVFRVSADGREFALLHQFGGAAGNDGSLPLGNLIQGSDQFLYGTTYSGGNASDTGTIFRVATNGTDFTVLHVFGPASGTGGAVPVAGLVESSGWLYGTTTHGGINDGGVAFKLKPDGSSYAVLHRFTGLRGDGSQPFGPLLVGSGASLFGSTYFGGDYGAAGASGTLFRLFDGPAQVRITSISCSHAGTRITFAGGAAGQSYAIEATTNSALSDWHMVGASVAGIDGVFQFFDPETSSPPLKLFRSLNQVDLGFK